MTVGNTSYYYIEDGTAWEVGLGTLSSSTVFARTSVLFSSSSGSAISLSGSAVLSLGWTSTAVSLFAQLAGSPVFTAGIGLGSTVGSSSSDVSKQIALYGSTYGLGVTSARLNVIAGTGSSVVDVIGGTDVLTVNATNSILISPLAVGSSGLAGAGTAATVAPLAVNANGQGGPYINIFGFTATFNSNGSDIAWWNNYQSAVYNTGWYQTTASPFALSTTASAASGQAVLSMSNTTGIVVGQKVTGTNIPAAAFVSAVTASTSITLNTNLVSTVASGTVLTFYSWARIASLSASGTLVLAGAVQPTTPVAVAYGGTGDTGTAWTAWTPTLSAASGTFTSAVAAGRYKTIGKTCFFTVAVTITTNGSAAGSVNITMPFTAQSSSISVGRETASTGAMLQGALAASGTTMTIFTPTNTYPGASGYVLQMTGVFETT
jgi:hypothetical protein